MSAEEWQAASKLRRGLERIYRSGFGQGLYYTIEMWWKKLILPSKKHVGVRRAIFIWDNVLVLSVGAAWITALVLWAVYDNHSVTWTLLCGFVLPFLAFNCIMGWVIYVQHTHPEVAWFDKRDEWQKRLGFITTTINVVVPKSSRPHPARHPRARRSPREHRRAAVPPARGADRAEDCRSAARARLRAQLEALLGNRAHLQAVRLRQSPVARFQGPCNGCAAVPGSGSRRRLIHRRLRLVVAAALLVSAAAATAANQSPLSPEFDARNWASIGRTAGETHYSPLTKSIARRSGDCGSLGRSISTWVTRSPRRWPSMACFTHRGLRHGLHVDAL